MSGNVKQIGTHLSIILSILHKNRNRQNFSTSDFKMFYPLVYSIIPAKYNLLMVLISIIYQTFHINNSGNYLREKGCLSFCFSFSSTIIWNFYLFLFFISIWRLWERKISHVFFSRLLLAYYFFIHLHTTERRHLRIAI